REGKRVRRLVRLELEARPPGAAVTGFAFTAHPDKPRRAQLTLFGPPALSPDRLATTIARLASMLGPDRVGSPRAVDGHRPERFAQVSYAPPPPPALGRPPRTGRGLLAVRGLRPPLELEVITSGDPPSPSLPAEEDRGTSPSPSGRGRGEGRPPTISNSQLSTLNSSSVHPITRSPDHPISNPKLLSITAVVPEAIPRIDGKVKVSSGPWSLEDSWWSEAPADRDYWDVDITDGALYRIYRDRAANRWYADGVYD